MADTSRVKPVAEDTPKRRKNSAAIPVPRKPKLGQNFLADRSYAERIVQSMGDISQSTVLEIGPGRGALTEMLARNARKLIAIELDRVLAAQLRMKFALARNVEILEADILAVDLKHLLGPRPGTTVSGLAPVSEKVKVVGNIPYYITSDILLRLFEFHSCFSEIVLMMQLEVAERVAANPGSRDYGVLSATAQLYTVVEQLFNVPPGAFNPPPKVHSSVLRMKVAPRFDELGVAPGTFVDFLKLSFAQKRKTLLNNLKERHQDAAVRKALAAAKLRADVRAEAVSLEKAAVVFKALTA